MTWNCAATCIGSLPHTDPAEAVSLILSEVRSIPFWPQLPSRGFRENMYAQYSHILPGIIIDNENMKVQVDLENYDPEAFYMDVISEQVERFEYSPDHFSGFYEFMERDLPEEAVAVKGQVTGPVSTGLQITDQTGKAAIYDEAYGEIVRKNLNMMARWQERRLREKCGNTIIFLDEPYLSLMGTPFASIKPHEVITWINEVIEGLEGTVAIHCCGNTDWPTVMATDIDILSFDAYDYGHTIGLYSDEVADFLENGGALAWGLIPNDEEVFYKENINSLAQLGEKLIRSLEQKGIDLDLVVRNSLITPQCGLGGVQESASADILRTLAGVSSVLSERFGLEG
ncbi:MAG: hypothetical protein ACLFUV_01720 [Methanomassiliicoccales archaeon]